MITQRAPRVVIRTDASSRIGSGHVMRCLTLAGELREAGAEVSFLSREFPGHLCDTIERLGFAVDRLPGPADGEPEFPWLGVAPETEREQVREVLARLGRIDCLVVDHYGLDRTWEAEMRPWASCLAVIDDLANRPHDCDVLLDQNFCAGMETRYHGLLPAGCRTLIGPRYALLRPEFREAKRDLRSRDGRIRRVLVFFGGGDATNETGKALDALQRLERPDLAVDVVVGASNPHLETVRERCATLPGATLHVAVPHMAALMAMADLSVGAGGTTTWERCYLGLPTLISTLADNQVPLVEAVSALGAAWNLGPAETVSVERLESHLRRLMASPREMSEVSGRALALMEGNGQGSSLASVIVEACHVRS